MFVRATTIDDAIDEVRLLAATLPGDFVVDVVDHEDVTAIMVKGTLISSGCDVEIDLRVGESDSGVEVPAYRVSVRHDGALVWRADKHSGHEEAPRMRGRQEHRHVMKSGREIRVPDRPQTLESIRHDLILTNLEHFDGE